VTGGTCANPKCFAKWLPGEEWTQNGDGWLCENCSRETRTRSKTTLKMKSTSKDSDPTQQSSTSSSSSSSSSSSFTPWYAEVQDIPAIVEWRLHKDGHTGPVELPPKVQEVADFFAKVYSLRLKDGEDRPVPFACRWVGGYLGMSEGAVWRALRILESEGVLKRMDPLPGRGKKGVDTYLPGTGS
jgi:hypothetical protein